MRTRQRDTKDTISISGRWAQSGNMSGVSNGVIWTAIRVGVGFYDIHFDSAYMPVSVVADSDLAGYGVNPYGFAPGYFGLRVPNGYAGAGTSDSPGSFTAELRRAL
jgi:hypothetical protein